MTHIPTPAETYEAFMVRYRFRPWADILLDHVEWRPGSSLLDVACGTGIVARTAAARMKDNRRLVGLDMNLGMLQVARSESKKEGVAVAYAIGMAGALPFVSGSFDVVTIQQGLQFFPDQLAALRECRRVLRPGGCLAVGIWGALEKQGVQRSYAEAIERVTGSASMHGAYGTTTMRQLGGLMTEAGFAPVSVEEATIELIYDHPERYAEQMVQGTSAGVPAMRGRTDEERAALIGAVADEMAATIRLATVDGKLVTESTSYLAIGVKPAR